MNSQFSIERQAQEQNIAFESKEKLLGEVENLRKELYKSLVWVNPLCPLYERGVVRRAPFLQEVVIWSTLVLIKLAF